jgi:hypothetical protein
MPPVPGLGDPFPALGGTSAAGTDVALPAGQAGRPFVAVFGFSRDSAPRSRVWGERIAGEYGTRVAIYALPVLDTVPAAFHGLALALVRKATPADGRERVVPLFDAQWRAWLRPPDPDDPAVVVVGSDGRVAALHCGPYSDGALARLRSVLDRF